jgi:tetratricopeptide repeat protein 21B
MRQDVATLLLLAEVQSLKEPTQEMQDTLKKAKDLQKDVVGQVRMGPASVSDVLDQEKVLLSEICEKIASSYLQLKSPDGYIKYADQMYEEALQYNAINVKAMLGLVKLCKNRSEMEQAQSLCRKIISADPGNEEATIILSEIMFNGSDPETAVHPLQDLLKSHPNNYRALEKLIILHRRAGLMKEIPSYLSLAETANKRSATHAGLHYCQGLYARYTNDVGKEISEFNLARRDEDWGCDALQHMIELYLNPNQDGAWEEKDSGPLDEISLSNNAAAEILLKELEPKIKDQQRFIVLQNYWLLATRQKANIDKAMQSFIAMLEKDQDYLPAVLGMATGFMVEKNQHKARNLLKRVAKMEATKQDGEDFGKANLLLAKFFVDKSMYDQAQDLCKKTLAQDKSSSQAWEILGLIMEKEGDHDRAAECYQKAWILEFEASAPVGYKLAFCYLKCKKYVEAIDVCETVLQQYPDYPKIKEEILKKAQLSLRSSNQ